MNAAEWRSSPELVTWSRTSREFQTILDVVRRELVRAVSMQDGVNRGWSQCYMTLESLMEPLEDVKSEPPRMFDLGAEDQPVSD